MTKPVQSPLARQTNPKTTRKTNSNFSDTPFNQKHYLPVKLSLSLTVVISLTAIFDKKEALNQRFLTLCPMRYALLV
jgi:hypothetical protein